MDNTELFRVINTIMAVGVASLALIKLRILWSVLHIQARLMFMAFMLLIVTTGYSSFENLVQGNAPGFRVSFVTAALFIALIAFLWPDKDSRWMTFWLRIRSKN